MDPTDTIASLRERAERGIDRHQRAIERATAALGRPRTAYVIAIIVCAWVTFNVVAPLVSSVAAFDPPPFFWLQGTIGLSALLTATLVLITQNRQTRHAEERAHLELQVNLLAEEKITKLIALVEELRRDLPMVRDRVDETAERMQQSVDPEQVLRALAGKSGDPDAAE